MCIRGCVLLLLSALAASRTVNLDVNTANPLVSVVVPGVRDPALLQRLVESVARQSYSNIELLIVDDSEDGAKQSVINSIDANWVKYSRYTSPLTMGAAVGIAASLARGRAIILWSEYDMYSNDRVEAQVRPLFSGVSQVTVIDAKVLYSIRDGSFYDYSAVQRFVPLSLSFLTSVMSAGGGPCAFPGGTFDEESFFLSCAVHHEFQVSSADASLAVRVLFDPKAASASFLQWKDGHTFNTAVAAGLVMLSDPAVGIPSEQDAVFFKALAGVAASGVIAIQQHAAVESLDETLPLPRDLEIDLFAMPRSSDEYGLWPRLLGSRHGRRMRNLMPARTLTGRYAATAQTVASQAQPASTSPSSSTCNSTSYFDGVQCQLCSACGIGEVVSIPCTYDSNTVCIVVGEPSLGSIVTSIMSQLTSARLQADVAVAELANVYLTDPLLKAFTVPRLTINQASVNLELAIANVPVGPAALQGLADAIQPAIKETLPNFIALNASSVLSGLSPASLAQQTATLILQSSLISLDNDTFIAELIVQAGLNLLSPQSPPLTRVLQTTDTLSAQPAANGNLAGSVPSQAYAWELNAYVVSIRTVIDAVRAGTLHELGILISSSDLAPVDPLKISTISLTFQEESYTWESTTDSNGNAVNTLVTG